MPKKKNAKKKMQKKKNAKKKMQKKSMYNECNSLTSKHEISLDKAQSAGAVE